MKLICSLFITFLKIGAFTFGGGYAMIALLENEFVEKKKWLEKSEFLDMVAVAESTPGPVAINSAHWLQNCRICGCNHVHTCCQHSIFLCNLWYLAVL